MSLRKITLKEWNEEDDSGIVARRTEVLDSEGNSLDNIYSIKFEITAEDHIGRAVITLADPQIYFEAEANYLLFDPNAGKYKVIEKVIFDDNTELDFTK